MKTVKIEKKSRKRELIIKQHSDIILWTKLFIKISIVNQFYDTKQNQYIKVHVSSAKLFKHI